MNSYYLAMFLYFAVIAYLSLTSSGLKSNHAKWTYVAVRKPLNKSIVAVTFDTVSLTGCASACRWSTKIDMALSFNLEQGRGRCHCNNALDDTEEDPDKPEVTYGILKRYEDCHAYYKDGIVNSGYYKIQHSRNGPLLSVYCSMRDGVGLTSIQQRLGDTNGLMFNRSLSDYVNGFVNETMSGLVMWIGLELLHHLTKQGSELEIQIAYPDRYSQVAIHSFCSNFTVGDAASNYTMYVSCRPGRGGDSLSSHNGMPFSAPNGDNECADACAGGWWYTRDGTCGQAILNRMAYDNPQCPTWATSLYNVDFNNQNLRSFMLVKPFGI